MDLFLQSLSFESLESLKRLVDQEMANRGLVEPTEQEILWMTDYRPYPSDSQLNKIRAVKSLRERLGCGLGPAKWTVEKWIKDGFKPIPLQDSPGVN